MEKIIVEEYSPLWAAQFEELMNVYLNELGHLALAIEHVGSTAVKGLAAKPILDIDIVIENEAILPAVLQKLEAIGYRYSGNLGIEGREAFKQVDETVPFHDGKIWPMHHLYVCPKNSVALRNHLALRDYLRRHPEAVAAYSALKKGLAERYGSNISLYVEHKTPFITGILAATGFDEQAIAGITRQNKAR